MRVIELGGMYLVRQPLCELFEQAVLVMTDGNVLILSSVGDDLHQTLDLCLVVERHAEQL